MGAASFGDIYWSSDILLTEKEKNTFEFLSSKIDHYIMQYVHTKKHVTKARNMYEGRRDMEDFAYITEAYGLQNALDLEFTPIIKPRIDILLGEMLRETFRYTITCLDKDTIDKIEDEKEKGRLNALLGYAKSQLEAMGDTPTSSVRKQFERINKQYGKSFRSNYVKGVGFLIEFFRSDPRFDMLQKLKQFFLDLLLIGEAYYRVKPNAANIDPEVEIIKPENLFYNKNTNSQYIDTTDAIVHRELLSRQQVLEKFGHLLSEDDLKNLFSSWSAVKNNNMPRYSRNDIRTAEEQGDLNAAQFRQWSYNPYETVEVFHVEFLSHNKVDVDDIEFNTEKIKGDGGVDLKKKSRWREDRYEGYRIGQNVYFGMGRSSNVHRSQSNPYKAGFSYDGLVYNDRNGEPYSLGNSLASIQDKYDLLMYFRDNLIANAGAKGSRINLAGIPKALGAKFEERLEKFMAYRKQGVELIDTTETGAELFNHYGDYDNSIDGSGLDSIQRVLESLEAQADIITGVNRQAYGNIQEKDAVSNVKVGIERSSLMVKDYFSLLGVARQRMYDRLIKEAQIMYKEGKRGSYVLGSHQVTFSVIPEYFCHSDYGLNFVTNEDDVAKVDKINGLAMEMAGAGILDPQIMFKIAATDSLAEIMDEIEDSMFKTKQERDEVGQLNQQLEETTGQLDEVSKELEKAQSELEKLRRKHFDLEDRKVAVQEKKLASEDEDRSLVRYNTHEKDKRELDLKRRTVGLEEEELLIAAAQGSPKRSGFNFGNRKEVNNKAAG